MLEPLESRRAARRRSLPRSGVLAGRRVLITAGPTRERIDPVRFISNRSSGKMGFAVAQAAREAGAEVVLVGGAREPADPPGVRRIDVESAADMLAAVLRELAGTDVFISTAAVADYRPARAAQQKIKKTSDTLDLAMERTPDVLATVAARAESAVRRGLRRRNRGGGAERAHQALKKNLDMIAANEVGARQGLRLRGQSAHRARPQCAPRARRVPASWRWRADSSRSSPRELSARAAARASAARRSLESLAVSAPACAQGAHPRCAPRRRVSAARLRDRGLGGPGSARLPGGAARCSRRAAPSSSRPASPFISRIRGWPR